MRTDSAGTFTFDSLPGDAVLQVSAVKFRNTQNMTLAFHGAGPVEIVLEVPGAVRGRATDAGIGRPVSQLRVRANFSRANRAGDLKGSFSGELSSPGLSSRSDEGRFLLGDLTVRLPLELIVEAEGYERAVLERVVATAEKADGEVEVAQKGAPEGKLARKSSLTIEILGHEGRSTRSSG